jgi:hypothetical protein
MERRVCDVTLYVLLASAFIISGLTFGQQASKPQQPTSFVAQLAYTKTDVTSRTLTTCIAVLPDGNFHLEKSWASSPAVGRGMQVFEGRLPEESLKSLTSLIAVNNLKGLTSIDHPVYPGLEMLEREIFRSVIPTPDGPRYLILEGRGALPPEQLPKPLPVATNPWIHWIDATRKQVEK